MQDRLEQQLRRLCRVSAARQQKPWRWTCAKPSNYSRRRRDQPRTVSFNKTQRQLEAEVERLQSIIECVQADLHAKDTDKTAVYCGSTNAS